MNINEKVYLMESSFTVMFDHQNMGVKILFAHLHAILAEIFCKIEFSIMAALICIKRYARNSANFLT